jgi:hypothetical protein
VALPHKVPFKDTASLWARRLGCECFPLVGKEPALGYSWRKRQLGKSGTHEASAAAWEAATGFAVAPVGGSPLTIIDCDDTAFATQLLADIPTLQNALTVWRADHCHIYVLLAQPLPKAVVKLKNKLGSEIASLRGPGSYVAGPYSIHESGDVYTPKGSRPASLSETETQLLLAHFGLSEKGKKREHSLKRVQKPAAPNTQPTQGVINPRLIANLAAHYRKRKYIRHGDWLNGPCPNAGRHKNRDKHPSFGFNLISGVGHCFLCGWIETKHLSDAAGISWQSLGLYEGMRPSDAPYEQPNDFAPQDRRVVLIAAHCTRAVRLMDMLRDERKTQWSRAEILAIGERVGWSRAQTDRNIAQAIDAGLLRRLRPGLYQRLERFKTPSPAKPFGVAYSGHPARYREVIYTHILHSLQPHQPTSCWPTTQKIATASGVSRRTAYHYEERLPVRRYKLFRRKLLPQEAHSPCVPDEALETFLGWRKGYYRFDVVTPRGETLLSFELGNNPAAALSAALKHAQTWDGTVLYAKALPSMRLLPGQRIADNLPRGARLSQSQTHIYIDPPMARQFPGRFWFSRTLSKKQSAPPLAGALPRPGALGGGNAEKNISVLRAKHEKHPTLPVNVIAERVLGKIEKKRKRLEKRANKSAADPP